MCARARSVVRLRGRERDRERGCVVRVCVYAIVRVCVNEYVCACAWVLCVCVCAREREGGRKSASVGGWIGEVAPVSMFVYAFVCV